MDDGLRWRDAEAIEVAGGYFLTDAEGRNATTLKRVRTACEGGFVHVAVPGSPIIQVLSAPALLRITYKAEPQAGCAGNAV
jgi:hypothetical protein